MSLDKSPLSIKKLFPSFTIFLKSSIDCFVSILNIFLSLLSVRSLKYLTSSKVLVKDNAKLLILFNLPIFMASLSFSVRHFNLIFLFSRWIPLLPSKYPSLITFVNKNLLFFFTIFTFNPSKPILRVSFNFNLS